MATQSTHAHDLIAGRIVVPATEVGSAVFGWSSAATAKRVQRGTFPLPVRELRSGSRSTWWVAAADLREFIDDLEAAPA